MTAGRVDRRRFLAGLLAGSISVPVAAAARVPLVEVIGFRHPPVESALKPLRQWLAGQGTRVSVVEIDMEGAEARRRLDALGVSGHVPIVIVIDGQYRHRRGDGSVVEFAGFPGTGASRPGAAAWTIEDLQAVVQRAMTR